MKPFNPLDKRNIGISVAKALLSQPMESLPAALFEGAGIYALYYTGNFPLYQPIITDISSPESAIPIYVGKAVPAGARIGGLGLDIPSGIVLATRLREHASSLEQAYNLNVQDFYYRSLIVDDIWIPLGESLLIEMFSPLWNTTLTGFGNHDPGRGRYNQQKSFWDTVHPGRIWANNLQPNMRTELQIIQIVQNLFTVP